ncbi:hypothetical protein ASPTUDRAFT_641643 [Aspergillus tubingensis CBS 134.48]|uniref:Uncharacterized protein n=1 Tax=Aspergillus tubingensis (strain CBS 134.48) TaxID=767770 RepID=A0A1L9N4L2_ASPTC|nr:hypothetical protein ASPTUDRAFT_641643 [Aspergillus tubingensis CBS 134.48]
MGMFPFSFLLSYSLRGIESSLFGACLFQRKKRKISFYFSFFFLSLFPPFSLLPIWLSHAAGTKYSIFIITYHLSTLLFSPSAFCKKYNRHVAYVLTTYPI